MPTKLFPFLVEQLFIFLSHWTISAVHFTCSLKTWSLIGWETLPDPPLPCSWPVPAGAAGPPLQSSGAMPVQGLFLSALLPLKQEQKGPKMLREESNDSHYDASIDGGVSVPKSASRAKCLPASILGQSCEIHSECFYKGADIHLSVRPDPFISPSYCKALLILTTASLCHLLFGLECMDPLLS